MRILTKAALAAGLVYAGYWLYQQSSARSLADADATDDDEHDQHAVDAELVGIADVDPVPLSGMGEAMDPDAIAHAHQDLAAQRRKMPRRGKNTL